MLLELKRFKRLHTLQQEQLIVKYVHKRFEVLKSVKKENVLMFYANNDQIRVLLIFKMYSIFLEVYNSQSFLEMLAEGR